MIKKIHITELWLLGFLLTLRSIDFEKLKTRKLRQQFLNRCRKACINKLTIRSIKWATKNKIEIEGL